MLSKLLYIELLLKILNQFKCVLKPNIYFNIFFVRIKKEKSVENFSLGDSEGKGLEILPARENRDSVSSPDIGMG